MPALAGRDVSVLIWTTTPWTIPSNLAVAFHPEFDYAAYDVDGRAVIVAEALAPTVAAGGRQDVRRAGRADEGRSSSSTSASGIRSTTRDSLGVLGDYVTLDAGTGAVHTAPGHGADDFNTGMRYGLEIYAPIGPAGHFLDTVELFGGQRVFDANPKVEEALEGARPAVAPRDVLASVPALLALPQPGDLPGDVAVVHPDGRRADDRDGGGTARRCAQAGARRDRPRREVDSGVGPRPHLQHGREPARLVHLAPARLGRADSRRSTARSAARRS